MAIEWNDSLSIGVGNIDQQHREIFRRYNDFLAACKSGKGRDGLLELIDFLVGYVVEHFAHEEKFMREFSYPDAQAHEQQHRDFTRIVVGYKSRLATEGPSLSLTAEINRALLDWLVDHIKKTDMELGSYLNQKWGLF